MVLAENPRARIGGNNPPPDEPKEDKSPPTPEEARKVYETIAYVQFKCPGLDGLMEKKKGKRKRGWRLLVLNLLKGRGVRQNAVADLLGYNRKTIGDDMNSPDLWAESDPEFEDLVCRFRAAVEADAQVDTQATEEKLIYWAKEDAVVRKAAERMRLHLAAALEAERAADALEAQKAAKLAEAERIKRAKAVEAALKGQANKEALAAQQLGADLLAKKLPDEAISALALFLNSKDGRRRESEFKVVEKAKKIIDLPVGLDRCKRLRLARISEPTPPRGVPPPADPRFILTDFGSSVAAAAVALGRIQKKKRKKQDEEEDDED